MFPMNSWSDSKRSGSRRPVEGTVQRCKSGANPAQIWRRPRPLLSKQRLRLRLRSRRTGPSSKTKKIPVDLSEERSRLENEWWMYSSFQRRFVGYSGECFWFGNKEWMYSLFQRRLVTLETIFYWEMSKCSHHFREDWLLWRTFSFRKWRVNLFII